VDDHGDSLDMFVEAVEFCGASALGSRSAQEAAAHLAEVDVVVTDLAMPDRDGIWLLDQVRRLPRRVRVLAVTGVAAQHNARLAAAPFDRILLKPLDPFRLCDEIAAVLRE
jgi:CheY-like chemotaxis protein